jgi:hypothetical protein
LESDTINCQFNWYVNYSSVYNDTQSPCTNSSLFFHGNYTEGDKVYFTINATDSYGGTAGPINSSFTINNYTYTTPQYETVRYNYSINFSISAGDENVTANLEYHNTNISAGCSNVSTDYYCFVNNLEAYPLSANGTIDEATWYIQYDSPSGQINETQDFKVTIYEGIWATNITSVETVVEQTATTVNVTYGYAANIQGTVAGTALLGSSSGSFTCATGSCSAPITAPDVDAPTIYQTEANLTLTSSYWSETSNKTVRIERTLNLSPATSAVCYGEINCVNGYDNNWSSYYGLLFGGDIINVTFTLDAMYNLTYWEAKDAEQTRNKTIHEDCWGSNMTFGFENLNWDDITYYCLNQTNDEWVVFDTETTGTAGDRFYESRIYYEQNNSLTRVNPYGLTDCSTGVNLFNYSCRDEDSQALMNCNYSQTFTLVSAAGTNYDTFSGDAQEWQICYYPEGLSANISSIEQYSATSYQTRDYFLFDVATGNTSYNQTVYMVDDTDGKLTYIYVKRQGLKVPGVYVYIQKHFVAENAFRTVAMVKTDETDGKGGTYTVPNDVWYRFQVYDSEGNKLLHQSETQHVACAPADSYCIVTLNIEENNVAFWDYVDGIASNCTWTNATRIIACSWNVLDGTSHTFTLYVYNITHNKTLLYNASSTSSSGTMWYDIGDANTTGRYTAYLIAESTPWILQDYTIDLSALIDWGEDGLIIALVIILVCTFLFARAGAGMTVLGAYLGLVVSWLFQFLKLGQEGLGIIAGLGVLVAVVMFYVLKE